jgi:hypothetical protein
LGKKWLLPQSLFSFGEKALGKMRLLAQSLFFGGGLFPFHFEHCRKRADFLGYPLKLPDVFYFDVEFALEQVVFACFCVG